MSQSNRTNLMRTAWQSGQVATNAYRDMVSSLVRPGMRILHAGCGWDRNRITEPHKDQCEVVGVDLDPRVAEMFHSEFHLASLTELPFADQSFDLVVSEYVWEHLDNPAAVFRELARLMKSGSRLVVLTPSKWSYKGIGAWLTPYRFHVWMGNIRYGKGHESDMYPTRFRCNTKRAFRKQAGADFEIVDFKNLTNGPTWFERLPVLFEIGHAYHQLLDKVQFLAPLRCAVVVVLERQPD